MADKKVKDKNEEEKKLISEMFLSEENKPDTAEDVDYISYGENDEYEEAERVLIPIEESEASVVPVKPFVFQKSADENSGQWLLSCFESIGEITLRIFAALFKGLFAVIKIPFILLWQKFLAKVADFIGKRFRRRSYIKDYKKFREDTKRSIETVKQARADGFISYLSEFRKHTAFSFKTHRKIWLSIVNVIFPIICLAVLFTVVGSYKDITLALQVSYNGEVIGYIENEGVYNTAKEYALERLATDENGKKADVTVPTYQISVVPLNKLNDANTICDGIIKNTEGDYVSACGIYINGEFVCATNSEADAMNAFDEILEPYKLKRSNKNATVAFVEEISYVQSFYPEKNIITADKVKDKITSLKKGTQYYTVSNGDTISGIAAKHNISLSDFYDMNPDIKENSTIYVGERVVVANKVKYVHVKVMKTEKRKIWIDYETETKETKDLYKGQTKTVQKGVKGIDRLTEMVTYIDGVKTYSTLVSRETLREPVNKIVQKGTKAVVTYPSRPGYSNYISGNGNTSYNGGKLSWPTSGAYVISSYYGYRTLYGRSSFHGGVDIIRSGGNSTGLPVLAAAGGTVVSYTTTGSYGYSVLIDHGNGLKTRYAHMTPGSVSVRAGSKVSAGQQVGRIGSSGFVTGPHLHFEVIINGSRVNPLPYIR